MREGPLSRRKKKGGVILRVNGRRSASGDMTIFVLGL